MAFAYHEPLEEPFFARERELLERWRCNWRDRGWETQVLREEDALAHPLYGRARTLVLLSGGTTSVAYRQATWMRWLAWAIVDWGVHSEAILVDYDVFNLRFRIEHAVALYQPGHIVNLHAGNCAMPIIADKKAAWTIPALLCAHGERAVTGPHGELHDDPWINELRDRRSGLVELHDVVDTIGQERGGPLIHIANSHRGSESKIDAWDRLARAHA